MKITRNGVEMPTGMIGDGPIQVDPAAKHVTCNGSVVFVPNGPCFRLVNGASIEFKDDEITLTQPNGVHWVCSLVSSKSTASSSPTSTGTTKAGSSAASPTSASTTTKSTSSTKTERSSVEKPDTADGKESLNS